MKVLVTGTEGYIGSQLASLLLQRGHEVIGLDTGYYREGWLYNSAVKRFPPCINKDIRQVTEEDLRGFDAIVHLAELSNDPLGQQSYPDLPDQSPGNRGTGQEGDSCRH
jgi:nucleoside-diphosphate-sugar epimerase